MQSQAVPPNTHGRVQGKHSCEMSWATAQMINLYGCSGRLLGCFSFNPLSACLSICLSACLSISPPFPEGEQQRSQSAVECSDCVRMKDGSKSRWMTKRMTTCMLWRYCRFGFLHPSTFTLNLDKLFCLEHWAAQKCVKHYETEFIHVKGIQCPIFKSVYWGIGGGYMFVGGKTY